MDARFAGVDLEIEAPSNCVVCICSMKLFCLWLKLCKVLYIVQCLLEQLCIKYECV
jgi:hypothetical protein